MVEINNLKHDIEALSAEREALRKEVESLEAKRDDLFEGVRDAEQMKCRCLGFLLCISRTT